jgi:hypothetical protein
MGKRVHIRTQGDGFAGLFSDQPGHHARWCRPGDGHGVYDLFDNAFRNNSGDSLPISLIILFALILGILWGFVAFAIESVLYYFVGRLFGGIAEWRDIFALSAWTKVPIVAALVFYWLPMMLIMGQNLFQEASNMNSFQELAGVFFFMLWITILIWYVVVTSKCLTEVHGFHSSWMGFGVFVVSKIVYIVPLLAISLITHLVLS